MHQKLFLTTALLLAVNTFTYAEENLQNPPINMPADPIVTAEPASVPANSTHLAGQISVNRFSLATNVVNHEPQNIKENFSTTDQKVFAFVELNTKGHNTVIFKWKLNGNPYWEFKTHVKDSPHWRTYGSVIAHPGQWTVSVTDINGNILKEASFSVGGTSTVATNSSNSLDQVNSSSVNQAENLKATDPKPNGVRQVLQSLEPAKGN